jgi:hypothetical protein
MLLSPAGLIPATIPIDPLIGLMPSVLPGGPTIHLPGPCERLFDQVIHLAKKVDVSPHVLSLLDTMPASPLTEGQGQVGAILEPSESTASMRSEPITTDTVPTSVPPASPTAVLPSALVARLDQVAAPLRDQLMLSVAMLVDDALRFLSGDATGHGLSVATGQFARDVSALRFGDSPPPTRARPSLRVDPPPSAARQEKDRLKFRQTLHDLLAVDVDPNGDTYTVGDFRYRLYSPYPFHSDRPGGLVVEVKIPGGYGHQHVAFTAPEVEAAKLQADADRRQQQQARQVYGNPFKTPRPGGAIGMEPGPAAGR